MTDETPVRQRALRSDRGSVRVTDRDLRVFSWLLSMKAIYETDMCVMLARWDQTEPIGEPAARALTRRWAKAELADAYKLLVSKPRIVRLLPGGAALLGDETYRTPAESTIYHQAEVARTRLWLEALPGGPAGPVVRWESERDFRQATYDQFGEQPKGVHTPDGVAHLADGTKVAVEVERAPKSLERLRTILERITTTYPLTYYFVADQAIARAVRQADKEVRDRLGKQHRDVGEVRVMPIPTSPDPSTEGA